MTFGKLVNDPAIDKYMRPKGLQKQNLRIRNKKSVDDEYVSNDSHAYLLVKQINKLWQVVS